MPRDAKLEDAIEPRNPGFGCLVKHSYAKDVMEKMYAMDVLEVAL